MFRFLQNSNTKLKAENMSLKMAAQRQNLRELLVCGELTPPRSDTSEPSLSPAPAPLSPPSPPPPVIKEEPDVVQNVQRSAVVRGSANKGLPDHTRMSLCAFLFIFLAFNPLGFVMNNMGRFDYSSKIEGRTILKYDGK